MGDVLKEMSDSNTKARAEIQKLIEGGKTTIEGIIAAKEEITCEMCLGWGHKARVCATLKAINKMVKDTPTLKAAWGSIKSKYLTSAAEGMVLAGHKRRRERKHDLKDEPKKLKRTLIM